MDPSPQFARTERGIFGKATIFTAMKDREEPAWDSRRVDGAFATLSHPVASSYNYSYENGGYPRHSDDGQGRLFNHVYSPPKIHELGAHDGMEGTVPALLGMAAHESLRRWGRLPAASNDLSDDSAPMVDHLVRRGIIEQPQNRRPHNSLKKGGEEADRWIANNAIEAHVGGEESAPEDVESGSRFTRSLLRGERRRLSPDHRQLEFDLGGQ